MSFVDRVRYRLGRWGARKRAFGSSLGDQAEWISPFQQPSGPLVMTKEAADDAIAQSDDPADREHEAFGTEL